MTTKRRRTKGEGSITKMANSKYRVRLDCGYVDGKRKQLSGTADSLTEARVLLRGFQKETEQYNLAEGMNIDFKTLTKKFLDYKKNRSNVKDSTVYMYGIYINAMLPYFSNKVVSRISTKDVDDFIIALRERGLRERSIKTYMITLGTIFNFAISTLKLIHNNPIHGCLAVEGIKRKVDIEILSESEFEALRGILQAEYDKHLTEKPKLKPSNPALLYIAFMIAYETGMREGEILGLRWSRINFQESTIHIDNQRVRISTGIVDGSPKSASSNRVIVISQGLIKILTKHKASFQFSEQDDYVFSKDFNGTKILTAHTLINNFKKYLLKAGITRRFTFHMIRHTNATRLIELSGNDYKTVSERLGHSSVSITFDVYAHTIKKQHQLAANLMDCTQ